MTCDFLNINRKCPVKLLYKIRYQADRVLQPTIWPCHVNLSSMVSDFNRKIVVTKERKILCFKTTKIDLDLEPEKHKNTLSSGNHCTKFGNYQASWVIRHLVDNA